MNKSQLIATVSKKSGLSIKDTEMAVDAILSAVKQGLKEDSSVGLPGFGSFTIGERAARTGINPRTSEKINIAASKTVKFKTGAKLKEILQNSDYSVSRHYQPPPHPPGMSWGIGPGGG